MFYFLVRHRVQNFDSWKRVYDEHAPARAKAGLRELQLLRTTDDANDLVILFEAEDLKKAHAFRNSQELREAMQKAGVMGTPEFLELQPAQAAVHR
ncbi:MAG: cyclase [Acidobacteria bacterium]|nr:MAG: cyclase [Acidobacteriota bacterium]